MAVCCQPSLPLAASSRCHQNWFVITAVVCSLKYCRLEMIVFSALANHKLASELAKPLDFKSISMLLELH